VNSQKSCRSNPWCQARRVLLEVASHPGDLLIMGAGHRAVMARMLSGKVSRYCLAHAGCPVLAIPPPALARELGHTRVGWRVWHRTVTPERVLCEGGSPAA